MLFVIVVKVVNIYTLRRETSRARQTFLSRLSSPLHDVCTHASLSCRPNSRRSFRFPFPDEMIGSDPFGASELRCVRLFGLFRIQVLLKYDAQFFAQRLQLVEVLLVLVLVLDLGLDTLEDAHGCRVVVNSPGGLQGGLDDGGGGD